MYQIFAVEPDAVGDYVFDQTYCQAMRLPFTAGWHHWSLFRRDGSSLTHIADIDTYDAAEDYLDALLAHSLH